jgi:hypothetical protein
MRGIEPAGAVAIPLGRGQTALSAWEPHRPPLARALICGRWFLARPRLACSGRVVWPVCGPAAVSIARVGRGPYYAASRRRLGTARRAPGRGEVGFFKRLSDKVVGPELEPLLLPGGRAVQVVGESYYQDALDAICGGKCEEGHQLMCRAELRPEPDNDYDKRAVGVYVDGRKVGHLSRADAKVRQSKLLALRSQGKRPMCGALISGGWFRGRGDEGHYGIRLDLDWS